MSVSLVPFSLFSFFFIPSSLLLDHTHPPPTGVYICDHRLVKPVPLQLQSEEEHFKPEHPGLAGHYSRPNP